MPEDYKTIIPLIQYYLAGVVSDSDINESKSYVKIPNTPFFTSYDEAVTFYNETMMSSVKMIEYYFGSIFNSTEIVIIKRSDTIPHKQITRYDDSSYLYDPYPLLDTEDFIQYDANDNDQGIKYLIPPA